MIELLLSLALAAEQPRFEIVPGFVITKAPPAKPVKVQPPKVIAGPYRSPPGFHRHVRVDGSILEHANDLDGNAAAHAGLRDSYLLRNGTMRHPIYNGPLPPTPAKTTAKKPAPAMIVWPATANCPNGNCQRR